MLAGFAAGEHKVFGPVQPVAAKVALAQSLTTLIHLSTADQDLAQQRCRRGTGDIQVPRELLDYFRGHRPATCEHVGPGHSLEVGLLAQTVVSSQQFSETEKEAHLSSNTALASVVGFQPTAHC